jgi:outer membrane protein assembly factor BamB
LVWDSIEGNEMRKVIAVAAAIACGQMLVDAERSADPAANGGNRAIAQGGASNLTDYWTDGADVERSGWIKNEKILTKANVGTLKLKWKLETGNQPRALHALMPVLVIGQLNTAGGAKQVGIVNGISDNLYAFDVESGKILWQKHWDYPAPAGRGGGGGAAPTDPKRLGFLQPGGSSDTPVIGPADAQGRRPVYFVTGDGMLHIINAADGTDLQPPYKFYGGKGWALNLVGNTLWMQTTYGGASIAAVRIDDPEHKVMTWSAGSGGAWGRRGVAVDSNGTAWTTTGDGIYDITSDPPRYANSVVGVHIVNNEIKLKDYYTPTNWEWLRKRDLDPNNTPTVFKYKGRELIAASGKECRLYLLDPESAGGENHQTPAYKTSLFCNEEVDFQDMGSWGALSSWEDPSGTRWVLAPFWGPVHSQAKFPLSYGPVKEGGVAAYKLVERGGKLEFAPAWVSRDMKRGEPVLIVNGMVIGYGSGEETKQAWPDIGLQFDSSIRAAKGTRATIYVLDAMTGKELWSSGDQIHQYNHFSGVTVANGRIYLGTYDGTLYCFGVDTPTPATK